MKTALVQLCQLSGVREVLLSEGGGMARNVTGIDMLAEPMRIAKQVFPLPFSHIPLNIKRLVHFTRHDVVM